MMDFVKRIAEIEEAREIRLKGGFNSIPYGLPQLDHFYPGWVKGFYYCITANSGNGKTQISKFLAVQQVYEFVKKHPGAKLKPKIIWFALEESQEQFMDSMKLNWLHRKRRSFTDMNSLNAYGNFDPIPRHELEFLKEPVSLQYYKDISEMVDVVDYMRDYTQILRYIYTYAAENGRFFYKDAPVNISKRNIENLMTDVVFDRYRPDDPNEYLMIVVDHISLVSGGLNKHLAIGELSSHFRMVISKLLKFIPIVIHQQANEQATNIDKFKYNRMTPDDNNLANNKEVQRDYLEIMGIFLPDKLKLTEYQTPQYKFPIADKAGALGYQNRLAFLLPLKSRFSSSAKSVPLVFYGGSFMFYPHPVEEKYLVDGFDREKLITQIRDQLYFGTPK